MTFFWQNPRGRPPHRGRTELTEGDKVEIAYFLSELSQGKRDEMGKAAVGMVKGWDTIVQEAELRAYGGTVGRMDPTQVSETIAYYVNTGQWENVVKEADASLERWQAKRQRKKARATGRAAPR